MSNKINPYQLKRAGRCFVTLFYFCFMMGGIILQGYANPIDPYLSHSKLFFAKIRHKPALLRAFVASIPKGGDLHNHLTGAIYPWLLVKYVDADPHHQRWCVKPSNDDQVIIDRHCLHDGGLLLDTMPVGSSNYMHLIDDWSMENEQIKAPHFGHNHFFRVFAAQAELAGFARYRADMLASLMQQAALEHLDYLELFIMPDFFSHHHDSSDYYANDYLSHGFFKQPSYAGMLDAIQALNTHGFITRVVKDNVIRPTRTLMMEAKKRLHCGMQTAKRGCKVVVAFQYEAIRVTPLRDTFANLYAGFLAAHLAPNLFVGVNLVAPEDNYIAEKDYLAQMRMIGDLQKYMTQTYGKHIHVSLHAGELTDQIVSSQHLKSHIYTALTVANADRIGHGLDVWSEEKAGHRDFKLLKHGHHLVEINLSSNQKILGVCDGLSYCIRPQYKGTYNHPFYDYVKQGIPVALSTDDQGILYTDLNHEYFLATKRYPLSYIQLKNIDRNALTYSFIPGKNLWRRYGDYQSFVSPCTLDNPYQKNKKISMSCKKFLKHNLKARLEWHLESQFAKFEKNLTRTKLSKEKGDTLFKQGEHFDDSVVLSAVGWRRA